MGEPRGEPRTWASACASSLPLAIALALVSACAHGSDPSAAERQAVVANNLAELQDCWDELADSQLAEPGISGSILFSVDLRRNGTVEWVDIAADELGLPKLSACAVRRIKRWRFPEDRTRRSISFGVGFSGS